MQAQQVRAAALQKGQALGDAALDSVAAAVEADKAESGWMAEEGKVETNETQAFIDSLSVLAQPEPQAATPVVKVRLLICWCRAQTRHSVHALLQWRAATSFSSCGFGNEHASWN